MKSECSEMSALCKNIKRKRVSGVILTPDGRLLLSMLARGARAAPGCWAADSPVSHQPAALASTMDCLMCDLWWLVRAAGLSGSPGS